MDLQDALKSNDLNFDVNKVSMYYLKQNVLGAMENEEVPDKKLVIRVDTQQPLGVVGDRYKLVSLKDALSPFETFIGTSEITPSKFYSERNGARVSCCFEVTGCETEIDNYIFKGEFVVRISHDGSSKILLSIVARNKDKVYPISNEFSLSVKHTKNAGTHIANIEKILEKAKKSWDEFNLFSKMGAANPISEEQAIAFIKDRLGLEGDTKQAESTIELIINRWRYCALPSMSKTIFGLYLAVCDWAQDAKSVRSTKKRMQNPITDNDLRVMKMLNDPNIYKVWSGIMGINLAASGFGLK